MGDIKKRKKEHVELSVSEDVGYKNPTGFENLKFVHNSLPEVDFEEVSTETKFMGRIFDFPLFISSMTGGYTEAGDVNTIIAEFCEDHNIPFGVGSQRVMLEKPETESTFSIVRDKAPSAFISSNIGGVQLIDGISKNHLDRLLGSIEADAVTVHLNPLQELMQPEGDRNFRGVLKGIERLVDMSPVPVIVKETGAGISKDVATRLLSIGVSVIDIAGSGGTSWAKIENLRSSNKNPRNSFNNWGIPTLTSLMQVLKCKEEYDFEIVASGGIKNSHDIAKALCLGADFTASARPVIKAVAEKGYKGLAELYDSWKDELKIIMTLVGCKSIHQLNRSHLMHIER